MAKLEIISEENSRFNDEVKFEQVATPKSVEQPKKRGLFRSIVSKFMGPDGFKSIINNLVDNQIRPALKNLVHQAGAQLWADIWYGVGEGHRYVGRSGYNNVGSRQSRASQFHNSNPRSIYDRNQSDHDRMVIRDNLQRRRVTDVTRSFFDDRLEAEDLLNHMLNRIHTLGYIKVSNYYEMTGRDTTPNDAAWGWYLSELERATVEFDSRSGYYISLPRPVAIN